MAGIPAKVVQRAGEILKQLESSRAAAGETSVSSGKSTKKVGTESDLQLSFFQLDDPVLEQVREQIQRADIDNLTPMQALNMLHEIKKVIGG
jgi:DNA mismatch repair protein MutS